MPSDSGTIQAVSSVDLPDVPDTTVHPAVGAFFADDSPQFLRDVLRLSQDWVAQLRGDDLEHEAILRLGNLAEELLRNGNASPVAMTKLRVLLCGHCRHCAGHSLPKCELLTKPGHGDPLKKFPRLNDVLRARIERMSCIGP